MFTSEIVYKFAIQINKLESFAACKIISKTLYCQFYIELENCNVKQ